CARGNITQVVRSSTRVTNASESLLDMVFVSSKIARQGAQCEIVEGISDHSLVVCTLTLACQLSTYIKIKRYSDFNNADDVDILDVLQERYWLFYNMYHPVTSTTNELWLRFRGIVQHFIQKFLPLRIRRLKKFNPWITCYILHFKRKIRRVCKFGNGNNISSIPFLRRQSRSSVKNAKHRFFNVTLHNYLPSDPRKFWRFLKRKKCSFSDMKLCNIPTNHKQLISNAFNEYFPSIFTVETGIVPRYQSFRIVIPDISITEEEVLAALLNLDVRKSHAPDDIPK
ncbi:hypothetical protein HPB47_003814, partial [Ixodes persulcatus]